MPKIKALRLDFILRHYGLRAFGAQSCPEGLDPKKPLPRRRRGGAKPSTHLLPAIIAAAGVGAHVVRAIPNAQFPYPAAARARRPTAKALDGE